MGRLTLPRPDVDPLTTVIGIHGTAYVCRRISELDGHIVGLCDRIRHATPRFPELVEDYRAEIDLLLDRRQWLELDPDLPDAA